ncbi:kynureninase/PvdN C-terminal domain-containing protein [Actinokineospora fastidiosa]|uniref:Kynureninase n=1 Tax=Actinokineospora fastidiosa TaxID=1816 RepID=A0A918GUL9_9PSEU|nr:kynureninase [Actinokineospora fastidiosa]GGS59278.1 kynureninase [Actinokineospora fastidiosa]
MSLAEHYTRFQVSSRLLLTGHSHQAWPDVARDAQLAAFDAAASLVDGKWGEAFAKADRVREHFRTLLSDPGGDIALGQNTHELVIRFLSALDLRARPRLVTTDGEFHTLRRQLSRLAEAGLEVVRVPAAPADTLAARLASEVDDRTAAVMVSSVLFETARIVPDLGELMAVSAKVGAELLVDAYHALGVVPFPLDRQGLADAWIVGGGYKYLQLGEGNCFLRLPAHAQSLRPVLTGWFAEFDTLAAERDPSHVDYAPGAHRFAGSTYDPTSHYRAARVADFFAEQGLTDAVLREISLRQTTLLATEFDALDLPPEVITRDRDLPRTSYGGFLALRSPRAAELQSALRERGVLTDNRGEHLRFGPAPYLTDDQLRSAMAVLKEVC